MGVVSECCCKEVYYRYTHIIIITFPYSTCISPFFGSIIPIFVCSCLNIFSFLLMLFLCNVIIKNC